MCSIFGAIYLDNAAHHPSLTQGDLETLLSRSTKRGRDGFGYATISSIRTTQCVRVTKRRTNEIPPLNFRFLIGNCRAEPTTEWVQHKSSNDQQPYECGDWIIVHNGTIANDKELRTGKLPTAIDSAAIAEFLHANQCSNLDKLLEVIKGSYAILAINKRSMTFHVACNYRPIWLSFVHGNLYFGSNRTFVPRGVTGRAPEMFGPYEYGIFGADGRCFSTRHLRSISLKNKTLVVCSSGLDSTVAAQVCKNRGDDVTLIHFQYGSRAEGPELRAIYSIAEHMKVPLVVKHIPIYSQEDSNLLNPVCDIAGGEAGAEYAHEWVPARNLVMLAIATAYAEAKGFNIIVLGNNLEEAGAYPDNEPEFIDRFNDILPFAVGDGKIVKVEMPVGNLMKHEIVALGLKEKAPMHLTWSCYKNGSLHCGLCGPCFMRRKAFEINGAEEVIEYASEH